LLQPLELHLQRQREQSHDFFWHRVRWHAVMQELPLAEPFELVDVGAGAGLVAEYLREYAPRASYRFIEVLPGMREDLLRRYGAAADFADRTSFGSTRFVTLLDVLEHQEDDRAFLESLCAKMEPGTTLILTVPALQMLWSRWDDALGHCRRYTRESLLSVLRTVPLEVREVSYLFPELLPMGLVRKWKLARRPQAELDVEFPKLPRAVNMGLYWVGRASLALRAAAPVGTSLLAVARKR
jgi:hypothetical protein